MPLEEYKDNLRTIIAYVRALPKGPAGPCSIVLVSRQRLPPPVRHARRRGRPPTSTEAKKCPKRERHFLKTADFNKPNLKERYARAMFMPAWYRESVRCVHMH